MADQKPQTALLSKLQICQKLGFFITSEFLLELGIQPACKRDNEIHYREADLPKICDALIDYLETVREEYLWEKVRKHADPPSEEEEICPYCGEPECGNSCTAAILAGKEPE